MVASGFSGIGVGAGAAEWTVGTRLVMALSCVLWSALQGTDPWQAGQVGPCKPYETSARQAQSLCMGQGNPWANVNLTDYLGLCVFWACGRSFFSTCSWGTDVWNSTQWIGRGQSCFGSYLGVKVKAADVSSSHLSAAGLLLKAHSWSQMLNGCQGQHVILNIWNYGRTALQACSCSFSLQKTQEVSQQWKPVPLSLVGSIHSLLSQCERPEMLSIFFEDELKQRLPMRNAL